MNSKLYTLLLLFCYLTTAFSLSVSPEVASKIGEKIWKNECACSIEGLTNWKKGENFASLGIGHFIWYSQGQQERFQETFPDMLSFLKSQGATLPAWLQTAAGCPWNSREDFYADIQSPKMRALRQFLFDTRELQALFIASRLSAALTQITERCSQQEKNKITTLLMRLSEKAEGLYALIDYVNFKGTGISPSETYKAQGWGLMQVLQNMPESSKKPLVDFVRSAKSVLSRRVENAPAERNEKQWLQGWFNRLDTYLTP